MLNNSDLNRVTWEQRVMEGDPRFVTSQALPPHVKDKDMKAYLSALIHGDPDAIRTIIATAKETWDGLFPGRK